MKKQVVVASLAEERAAGRVLRKLSFAPAGQPPSVVYWDISGPEEGLPTALRTADLAAVSLIFYCMRRGAPLHVEGTVTKKLLQDLEEFQDIWTHWRSDLYSKVPVSADDEIEQSAYPHEARKGFGICAFSGGVDGTATAWRHYTNKAGRASRKLRAGVLIRGFDLPLDNAVAWEASKASAVVALDDIGVPFVTLETNWRDICGDWEMEFGAGAIACLRNWEPDADSLLLGSCEDYARLVTPWGSHPLPTRLLGGDLAVAYDGGAMSRTEKVALLSEWPAGYHSLRVCWQGDITGTNCGVCEKCVRTKLNAIACGAELPRSLGERPTAEQISRITISNPVQLILMEEIIQESAERKIDDPLILALKRKLQRDRQLAPLKGVKRKLVSMLR